ncbi:hypothetical protein DS745_18480 [Anaerobacillus alkaliphilus]|uniref:SWIM-type domain-containing protein n=1 Tax=Anaerobacillus alkaliphilus TaxID=1548597 RepID=A0A4Q0VQQ4_9BACI|nr:SWIM zinc finger family protein [Anaerobacillus alkaliphilus]RXI98315.1 hypothetical protein DS745_18480 [Anaerobacillus alkaliphilus]
MNKEQLEMDVDNFLQQFFQSRIVERGQQYFYNGNVSKMDINNDKLRASVTGANTYNVELNLENLALSHCDCPYESKCKHMVAVLYELKKLLNNASTLSVIVNSDYSFENPAKTMAQLGHDLIPFVESIYQLLSKSGHFSNEHSNLIIKQFFEEIKKNVNPENTKLQVLALTVLIDGLYKKANQYETYRFRQNRFLAFFNELLQQAYPTIKEEVLKGSAFYEWYTGLLFELLEKQENGSPYEKLIATWLLCEERETTLIKYAELLLVKNNNSNLFITKLASLLFLQANDGVRSLSLLKELKTRLHPSDLIDHFFIMEQKNDYVMMKHWFDLFFPYEKPKQGTILGNLYEDMLVETGTSEEKLTIVWKNWLEQPSFISYKSRMKKMGDIEKKTVLRYILPNLKENLFRPQTEATYYQIISEEELFQEGIASLLIQKREVNSLTPEIEKLLKMVMKQQPALLLPFYHQLVERLVQKKSRVHYEEAAYYIKQLKIIYEKIDKTAIFATYLHGLRQRFKTFRAFIQELKTIDK